MREENKINRNLFIHTVGGVARRQKKRDSYLNYINDLDPAS